MKLSRKSPLVKGFIALALTAASLTGGVVTNRVGAQSAGDAASAERTPLSRYATDLTRLARLGRLSPSEVSEADVTKAVEALARGAKSHPVLLGESGAAAVAKGLARRVAAGEVPAALRGAKVYGLSRDALLAGAESEAAFAARLRAVFEEAAGSRDTVVLFVEDLHQYVGSYTGRAASDVTRAAAEGGRLRLVGATTEEIYGEHIAKDAGLARLFRPVGLGAPQRDAAGREDVTARAAGDRLSPDLRALVAGAKPGERVGVIIQADDLQNPKLEAALRRHGAAPDARMARLGALRVELPVKALEELAAGGGASYLSPDREFHSFGHVTSTTGADSVRGGGLVGGLLSPLLSGTTLDGAGVGIAVLDSGIDVAHKTFAAKLDLSGSRIKLKKDFTSEATNGDKDPYGHGSHVAAAAAGLSTVSGGVYEGVARGADIINLRVLNSQGTGRTSDLLAALDWILTPADPNKPVSSSNPTNAMKYKIRVANLSLGTAAIDSYKNDPLCKAVRRLVDAGIVVVAAAGNNGKDGKNNKVYGQIHSPGNEPSALTVGASNTFGTDARSDDGIATFSSRGPTRSYWTDEAGARHYDNLVKPDLVAPGNKLIYAESDDRGNPNLI
ncbi:MAG TPA: S8 family serine peptidase, partial [Pyrinomonadaceae bacterium]